MLLKGEVTRGAVAHHHDVPVRHLEGAVVAVREGPAVRLPVHSLGSQRSRREENVPPGEGRQLANQALVVDPHLDQHVLLRADALARGAVVVRAGLPVERGVHRHALGLDDLANLLQRVKLPTHEGVVEGVVVGGDERSAPVNLAAHGGDVALGQGREVVEPVVRIRERGNLGLGNPGGLHDVPLVGGGAGFSDGFALFGCEFGGIRVLGSFGSLGSLLRGSLGLGGLVDHREHGRVAVLGDLVLDLIRGGLDGHPGAVEGKGEEDLVALEPVVGGGKLELGEGEGVAEV